MRVPILWHPLLLMQNPIHYNLGSTFLAPRISHVHKTNGIVSAGSPNGKSQVEMLAVIGTVKQAAIIPMKSPFLPFSLNTMETAIMVKMALYP